MESAVLAFFLGVALTVSVVWLRRYSANAGRILAEAVLARVSRELEAQRQETERLSALFSAALRAFPQPVLVTSRDRTILLANPPALQLIGRDVDQVIGSVVARVIQDYETTRLLMEAARRNERQEETFVRSTTGQTWRVAVTPLRLEESTTAARTPESEPTHLILSIEDLTELRRLETVRRDFVAHVSHELRTPLAAVRLQAETLIEALRREGQEGDAAVPSRAVQQRAQAPVLASRILDEVDHLARMVAELLELSHIESGQVQMHREPTEIAGLVEVVVDRMAPLANERLVQLVSSVPEGLPDVLADSRRIEEVLVNLIDNALKYTPAGGTVTLSAEVVRSDGAAATGTSIAVCEARSDRWLAVPGELDAPGQERHTPMLVVRVADTGVGVAPQDLKRIFERFYKADRARSRLTEPRRRVQGAPNDAIARAAAGTGLGLAIAKHLVELHEGHIWAQSALGRGSLFSFSLPLAQAAAVEDLDAQTKMPERVLRNVLMTKPPA